MSFVKLHTCCNLYITLLLLSSVLMEKGRGNRKSENYRPELL